jgi:hypothetical protein
MPPVTAQLRAAPANHGASPAPDASLHAVPSSPRPRLRRSQVLKWLRRTHAWVGLWGAALGLLFGVTGIILNHRAVMKIPAGKNVEREAQLPLAAPPASPEALAQLLAQHFGYPPERARGRREPSRTVEWNGRPVVQPERWSVSLDAPDRFARGEYWLGNQTVTVKLFDANLFATLNRLHMGSHQNAAWILLADTLAGGLIFLALSGILLWTRLGGSRLLAAGLALGGLGTTVALALIGMAA